MSFMDLKHSNDDIDAMSEDETKWKEDMDKLAKEDLFGNHVEKIGVSMDTLIHCLILVQIICI